MRSIQTRLAWWPPRMHVAMRDGVVVQLTEPPDLGGGPVEAIDYAPMLYGIIRRRPDSPAEEAMTQHECRAADRLLRHFLPSGPVPLS